MSAPWMPTAVQFDTSRRWGCYSNPSQHVICARSGMVPTSRIDQDKRAVAPSHDTGTCTHCASMGTVRPRNRNHSQIEADGVGASACTSPTDFLLCSADFVIGPADIRPAVSSNSGPRWWCHLHHATRFSRRAPIPLRLASLVLQPLVLVPIFALERSEAQSV